MEIILNLEIREVLNRTPHTVLVLGLIYNWDQYIEIPFSIYGKKYISHSLHEHIYEMIYFTYSQNCEILLILMMMDKQIGLIICYI